MSTISGFSLAASILSGTGASSILTEAWTEGTLYVAPFKPCHLPTIIYMIYGTTPNYTNAVNTTLDIYNKDGQKVFAGKATAKNTAYCSGGTGELLIPVVSGDYMVASTDGNIGDAEKNITVFLRTVDI